MFGDMMGKLQEMQQQTEEAKKRLDTIFVEGEAGDGLVKVIATGNREIHNLEISPGLLENKEELEDLLLVALNRALTEANAIWEEEMANSVNGIMEL